MNPKFSAVRSMGVFFGLSALLFVHAGRLAAQQIPVDELPPAGTDTALDGKYDPQNPFAQLVRGEEGVAKIFEDEHVIVFMPRGEVLAPGHLLVIPKRMGARNLLLDLKPDELRDLLVTVQKTATAQRKALRATGFKLIQNNGLSSGQTVYHAHFHVVPSFGAKAPGSPIPRREVPEAEYDTIAAKLRAAWPK
jgi:histidine triad (HIT) family protein